MATTANAAPEAAQEAKKAKKKYQFTSSNKYLTVAALGVQFMAGKYTTDKPEIAKQLMTLDGVELVEG